MKATAKKASLASRQGTFARGRAGLLVLAGLGLFLSNCAQFTGAGTGGALLPWAEFLIPYSPLNRIQTGTLTLTGTPQVVSISAVNLQRSFVYCFGHAPSSSQSDITTCRLSSASTVTIEAGAANNQSMFWGVVEFALGALVQRGTYSMPATEASADINIGFVDTGRSFVIVEARTGNIDGRERDERRTLRAYLTSSSTLRLERNASGDALEVVYQVVMLSSSQVTTGLTTLSGTSTNVAIPTINPSSTILLFNLKAPAATAGVDNIYYVHGRFSDASTITFSRLGTVGTVDIAYQVVTIQGLSVQSGTVSTSGGHGQVSLDATITAVDTTRSLPIVSNSILDTGDLTSNADQDSGRLSAAFTSSTNLRVSRASAQAPRPADVDWFVAQFPGQGQ